MCLSAYDAFPYIVHIALSHLFGATSDILHPVAPRFNTSLYKGAATLTSDRKPAHAVCIDVQKPSKVQGVRHYVNSSNCATVDGQGLMKAYQFCTSGSNVTFSGAYLCFMYAMSGCPAYVKYLHDSRSTNRPHLKPRTREEMYVVTANNRARVNTAYSRPAVREARKWGEYFEAKKALSQVPRA